MNNSMGKENSACAEGKREAVSFDDQAAAFSVAVTANPALMQVNRNQIDLLLETGASSEEARTALDKVLADHRAGRPE